MSELLASCVHLLFSHHPAAFTYAQSMLSIRVVSIILKDTSKDTYWAGSLLSAGVFLVLHHVLD